MPSLTHFMSTIGGWRAVGIVFLVPAAEASVFLGFVFPGETAVVLGGVIASQGKVALWSVLLAAVLGAVIGDSIGFLVGSRWGERILRSTVGRFVKPEHIERARDYVNRRGGRAVFFGRFAAALRALVPGTAGMAGMAYRRFLVWNVAGGTLWAISFTLVGYAAGASYRKVMHTANLAGLVVLGVVVLVAGTAVAVARRRRRRRTAEEAGREGTDAALDQGGG